MAKSGISKNRSPSQTIYDTCVNCGKEYKTYQSWIGKRKYCSPGCRNAHKLSQFVYDKCIYCGKEFRSYTSWIGKRKYCSKDCRNAHFQDMYHEKRICEECGEEFLSYKSEPTKFCSHGCYSENKIFVGEQECLFCGVMFKPSYQGRKYCSMDCYFVDTGKRWSIEKVCSNCGKQIFVKSHRIGRGDNYYCSLECKVEYRAQKAIWVKSMCETCGQEFSHKPSEKRKFCSNDCMMEFRSKNATGLPSFDVYSEQIVFAVENRRAETDQRVIEVKCAYCGRWHTPSNQTMNATLSGSRNQNFDLKFYCSAECKQECPIFRQQKYPKGFKKASSREVDPHLRQMCLERDEWECQKCGATESLHSHHIEGAVQNKMISNDLDNVITLCKACHKEVHQQEGCQYHELQCKENNKY